jgi:hypothetical protein
MTKRDLTDAELDNLFDAARRDVPELDSDVRMRMAEDAIEAFAAATTPKIRAGFDLRTLLGGWRGLGGLATAAIAGVWIGIAPPDNLPDPIDLFDQAFSDTYDDFDPIFGLGDLQHLVTEEDSNV